MSIFLVSRDKSQWLCTFCVFKINQEWFYKNEQSREEAMSCNVSDHMLVRQLQHPLFFIFLFFAFFGSSGYSAPSLFHQQECQYLLLHLCNADEHVVAANSSPSVSLFVCLFSNRSISPIYRSVWVFHHFSAAVGEQVILRYLQGDLDVVDHYRGQTQGGALHHCRTVCVQLGVSSQRMHFTQPGKIYSQWSFRFQKRSAILILTELLRYSCAVVLQDATLIAKGDRLKKLFDEEFKNVFFIV